jgi:hypothetical protein
MVRMKQMHSKRNPLRKGTQKNPRQVSRMEQAAKDVEGTFHTLIAPKGKATINRLEKEIKINRKGKTYALTQDTN